MTSNAQRTTRRRAASGLSRRTLRQMAGMLLIGCVPLLLFALLSFWMITRPMLENRRAQDRQSLLQIQQGVERVLLNTDVALTLFVESDSVLQALPLNMVNTDYKAYWRISKQLQQLQVFDAIFPDACLISAQGGWLINSSGMYRLDTAEFRQHYQAYLEGSPPSRWVTELDQSSGRKIYDYFFYGNSVVLVKAVPVLSYAPRGAAAVKIPCAYLNKFLPPDPRHQALLILDADMRVIADVQNKLIGQDLSKSDFALKISPLNERDGRLRIDTELYGDVELAYVRSSYNGFYYVLGVEADQAFPEALGIGALVLLAFLGSLLAIWLLGYIGLKKTYQPLASIIERLGATGMPQDAFLYIHDSIEAMQIKERTLVDKVNAQLDSMRNALSIEILRGDISGQAAFDQLPLVLSERKFDAHIVLVLEPDQSPGREGGMPDSGLLMLPFLSIAKEQFGGECALSPSIIKGALVLTLGGDSDTLYQDAYKAAERIKLEILKYLPGGFSAGIGNTFVGMECAHRAYMEALEALKCRIQLGGDMILFYRDVMPSQGIVTRGYLRIQKQLIAAFRLADSARVMELVEAFFDEVFLMQLSYFEYAVPIIGLMTEMIYAVQEVSQNFTIRAPGRKSLYEQLLEFTTRDEMQRWFVRYAVEPILDRMRTAFDTQYTQIAQQIQQAIAEGFDKGLTLELCAERLNYHPSYIRRVFYEVTGENFGECLNRHKMEAAKKWLRETNMKIADIAERLGYSNSQNFIRSFRIETGLTPGQYRKTC